MHTHSLQQSERSACIMIQTGHYKTSKCQSASLRKARTDTVGPHRSQTWAGTSALLWSRCWESAAHLAVWPAQRPCPVTPALSSGWRRPSRWGTRPFLWETETERRPPVIRYPSFLPETETDISLFYQTETDIGLFYQRLKQISVFSIRDSVCVCNVGLACLASCDLNSL